MYSKDIKITKGMKILLEVTKRYFRLGDSVEKHALYHTPKVSTGSAVKIKIFWIFSIQKCLRYITTDFH